MLEDGPKMRADRLLEEGMLIRVKPRNNRDFHVFVHGSTIYCYLTCDLKFSITSF
jgi:hypothetical protein